MQNSLLSKGSEQLSKRAIRLRPDDEFKSFARWVARSAVVQNVGPWYLQDMEEALESVRSYGQGEDHYQNRMKVYIGPANAA